MIPRVVLGESMTPDGAPLTLTREGVSLVVRVAGVPLMSSRVHGSEEAMAEVGCAGLAERAGVRVLVGGLGLGYTLRAVLDALAADAEVLVAELLPVLVQWNRGPLGPLANHPLGDPRTRLFEGDVGTPIRNPASGFDAILLDVDNGPEAFTVASNAALYGRAGLARLSAALRPGGRLVVWSAIESPAFQRALRSAGFREEVHAVRARGAVRKGARHWLFIAQRRG
jgi:spermidine synthase